ncbi:hypothetical protein V8F33_000846 [Rhypophila sp. PSN 637]
MHFQAVVALLAAASTLSAAAPVAANAPAALDRRGYTTLFCGGLCAPTIEDPPLYALCIAACVANGGEGFDPTQYIAAAGSGAAAKEE